MASGFSSSEFQSPQPGRFERAIPFRESKGPFGPFKATKIWNDLVQHVKSKVEMKRRRYKMRHIDSCFTGTDAVDVVLHFLLNDQDTFSADLSREKAVKVCQMLMQRKVFQSATDKSSKDKGWLFEDSSGKLYQFVGESSSEELSPEGLEDEEDSACCDTTQNLTHCSEKLRLSEGFEPEDEPNVTGTQSRILQELHDENVKTARSKTPLPNSGADSGHDFAVTPGRPTRTLTPEEVDDIWRESALTQLLTIVDLTFLDGILSEDKRSRQQQQRDHLIISNIVARSWHLPLTPSNMDSQSDPLLQTAMECIEFLPKGLNLLSEPVFKRRGIEAKLWAKDIIVKHFTSLGDSLLPDKYLELHMAILNFVLAGNDENALAALQLYMILLPVAGREELYRLLKFMRSLAADTTLRLDPQESNEMCVLRLLTDSIFQHKLLASNVAQKLVQFLMNNVDKVFTIPRDVRKRVAIKLYQLKTGKRMLACESSYCNRVSKEEFERQSKDCTTESLIDLMNCVLDDTTISLKEKKHKLKQFQKSYPELYEQNFEGML